MTFRISKLRSVAPAYADSEAPACAIILPNPDVGLLEDLDEEALDLQALDLDFEDERHCPNWE